MAVVDIKYYVELYFAFGLATFLVVLRDCKAFPEDVIKMTKQHEECFETEVSHAVLLVGYWLLFLTLIVIGSVLLWPWAIVIEFSDA